MFENIRCLANGGNHFCVCQYHRKLEFQFCFNSLGYYYDLSVDFNIFHMLIKIAFFFFFWVLSFLLSQFSLMFLVSYWFVKALNLLPVLKIFSLSIYSVLSLFFNGHAFNFYSVVCFQATVFINNTIILYLYNIPHVPSYILKLYKYYF